MSLPRISIVTPSYNAQDFIEETIVSVLDQNYPNLQYLIIDGGSTDRTPDIIRKYEKYLDSWISEPDQGQSDAIIKGLQLCDGDVFNWLNADDTYTAKALHTVGSFFSDPKTQVFAGRSLIYGMGPHRLSMGTDLYPDNPERTIGRARIDQPETFFRLSRVRSLGGPSMNFHFVMDREFWIRYLICYGLDGIIKTDDILVRFRHHQNSKTISQSSGFAIEDKVLGDWMLHLTQSDIGLIRSAAFSNCLFSLDLSKAKTEWCLHHFQMAYALRDWSEMDYWDNLIERYDTHRLSLFSRLNLRFRRSILSILNRSYV